MARDMIHKVQYYYDSHPTEEDVLGVTSWHASLVWYLKAVLTWLYQGQVCAIYKNLNFYQTIDHMEYPVAPDLAVIKGVEFRHGKSWAVGKTGPAPQVVFEILSEETWQKDVRYKPETYARMGVQEYFAYDPNDPPLRRSTRLRRLRGWRLDTQLKEMVEIPANEAGWLWSEHLESWLVPDHIYLRLYDREHKMRLTGEEAQTRQAEEATKYAQVLAEKLRSLGINPDEL